jgi:hypothetical protein
VRSFPVRPRRRTRRDPSGGRQMIPLCQRKQIFQGSTQHRRQPPCCVRNTLVAFGPPFRGYRPPVGTGLDASGSVLGCVIREPDWEGGALVREVAPEGWRVWVLTVRSAWQAGCVGTRVRWSTRRQCWHEAPGRGGALSAWSGPARPGPPPGPLGSSPDCTVPHTAKNLSMSVASLASGS